MIKAVLFDLDGTLVNSLEDLANSTNFALSKFGFPTHETELYKYFVGDGMQKLIERVLPESERDNDTRQKVFDCFFNHYREHYIDKTSAYDGIIELINKLKLSGIKLAVVSNKAEEMALTVVNKIFPNIFDIVCGKQDGFPAKPDAALTLKVINDLGVMPSECLFVGDSGMDMAAAVNANCKGVGVLWGFRTKQELLSNGADYIIENPL
ncbi:MAG: HAD family hydrolase, partial [Clostridia bacterium]|nr:HAD family hydrolase [Clostridia bacterium]